MLKIWAWLWSVIGINALNFADVVNIYTNVIKKKI